MRLPLLLVPGLMCDQAVWTPLMPALEQVADCVVVDHGDADSLSRMASQLLEAAPPRFALAGHSMGGRVALEVMRQAPERVTHLGLLDTGFKARPEGTAGAQEAEKRFALLELARRDGVRAMASQWVQGMVAPHRLSDAGLIDSILEMFERKTADVFARQIKALLGRPDGSLVLQAVKVPTLILCGREDGWAPVSQHEEMAALLPDVTEVAIVDGAGHMVTMESPQPVLEHMLSWLKI